GKDASRGSSDYIQYIRGASPSVEPASPADVPTSRCFRGTGQAYLNTTLLDAARNVPGLVKSSTVGTQRHGDDAHNAIMLYVACQPLLRSTGHRDIYGSDHHAKWMWSTRSTNSITVNGKDQGRHTSESRGRISAFATTPAVDLVSGEAGDAYGDQLRRFTRTILFVKPDLVLIYDQLEANQSSTFEYWLHAPEAFRLSDNHAVAETEGVGCQIAFLEPQALTITQTDQFDPPPRPRVKLKQWHLTATT